MSFTLENDIIDLLTAMKHEIPVKIIVNNPPPGIRIMVQRGKDELLAPSKHGPDAAEFDLTLTVDMTESVPNFLGKYAQGPKKERFIYVNSGRNAGQHITQCSRRAKISLMSITPQQIHELLTKEGTFLLTDYEGTARDGWPTCASVKGIEWKVARE